MNCLLLILLFIFANNLVNAQEECPKGPKIVCYYASWAYYREDIGFFDTNNIDTSLCTHIVYTFAGMNINQGFDYIDQNVDVYLHGMKNFTDLKENNPCLKTILAIGGWNEGSRKYSVMASEDVSRRNFAESALRFLAAYNFDGLDVDWEYPGQRGGLAEDKENFAALLKVMRERFAKWDLEISIAAPIDSNLIDQGYDVAEISKYVDHVSLMAYDYTATNSKTVGLLAPISEIKKSIELWLERGLPKEKLILGLPSYARSYTLLDAESHDIGALTNGTGRAGTFTDEPGFLAYYELQKFLQTELYETDCSHDGNCYAYFKNDWFSFDNIQTYNQKIAYAVEKDLGGLMLWTLDTDDFTGIYGTKYGILKAIKEQLYNEYRLKHLKQLKQGRV